MPNRLAQSNSPYLLQHKDNPVDWYPWGEEALKKARAERKPIFLSVGYAACHWCHVMAHESFEDESTAKIMNEHFVNIKVDREERPDIDGIYMDAVVALTGSGGWPMSVFLAPDGKAFLGGTYFPPEPGHQLPSFKQVLQHVIRIWQEEQSSIQKTGEQLLARIEGQSIPLGNDEELEKEKLTQAVMSLAQNYDWKKGGWGAAPKFPQAMTIDFLLGRATQEDSMARDLAEHALKAMAQGGMYDLAGGGFARYSVDNEWLVPHFEKMLYDNALLSRTYLHAHLISRDAYFRQICEESLDFIAREMFSQEGAFYSSLDADSEGEEGKFYVWEKKELINLWGEKGLKSIKEFLEIPEEGNFEGKLILRRKSAGGLTEGEEKQLRKQLDTLVMSRNERIPPQTDDKAITAWNGMMLQSFAEAARYLEREDYLDIAKKNAAFILENLFKEDRLLRSYRKGKADHLGLLEDYAALILGLLALYQSDPQARWYRKAEQLGNSMIDLFEDGELFDTGKDHEKLITRPQNQQDNATPSGSALACLALLHLHSFSGDHSYFEVAMRNLRKLHAIAARYPTSFAIWLQAMDYAISEGKEVVIITAGDSAANEMVRELWASYRPFDVLALVENSETEQGPPLARNRPLLDKKTTAYVCRNFECKLPVNEIRKFKQLIT